MKDESFRKHLIENPSAAIEAETGWNILGKVNIKVLEEDPKTVYLVIPKFPNQIMEVDLNNAELDSIAGGCSVCSNNTMVCDMASVNPLEPSC
jgi:hypothetical protein